MNFKFCDISFWSYYYEFSFRAPFEKFGQENMKYALLKSKKGKGFYISGGFKNHGELTVKYWKT